MYTNAFEKAVEHAMIYEVGPKFTLTDEVRKGLIDTVSQRRAVGYVDDPLDNGGETKFGVAKNANPDLDITNLTWDQAKEVYYKRYWIAGNCDKLSNRVALIHFDCCVNHGTSRAKKFLQEAVGATPDGIVGPATLAAVEKQDPIEICNKISDIRVRYYKSIVDKNPSQSRFLKGWLARAEDIRNFSTTSDI